MNRKQKRKAIQLLRAKGCTNKQIETLLMIKAEEDSKKFPKEGDKVRLNISQMMSRPEWKFDVDQNKTRFHTWVLAHRDAVLTVEYDKSRQNNPSIVCVVEDKTDPKWMFWEGDLDVIERVGVEDGGNT